MNPQELYEYILSTNVINFLIMIFALVIIAKDFKLDVMIDSLAQNVKDDVNLSVESVKKAFEDYKKAKKDSKNTENIKQEIIESSHSLIKSVKEKNEIEIKNKEDELLEQFEKNKKISFERKVQKTTFDIQNAIYEVSFDTISKMMNDDIQNKTISKSLDELDKMEGIL